MPETRIISRLEIRLRGYAMGRTNNEFLHHDLILLPKVITLWIVETVLLALYRWKLDLFLPRAGVLG
ncbi:hypothetical protein Ct9H90mP29_10830 [bacterium]|nr:MAG: hypothetical protein Ct9H90mP29_10830 [bacterium]